MRDVILLGYYCMYRAKLDIAGDHRNPEVLQWEGRCFYARDDSRGAYLEFDLPEGVSLLGLLLSGKIESAGELAPGVGGRGFIASAQEALPGMSHGAYPTPSFLLHGSVHPPTANS
jgi:hypothetical protein